MKPARTLVPFLLGPLSVLMLTSGLRATGETAAPVRLYVREVPLKVLGKEVTTVEEPISPNGTMAYKFPLVQSGTYWMHSHYGLQEQLLNAAPLIIESPEIINGSSATNFLATGMFTVLKYEGANTQFWQPEKTLSEVPGLEPR